MSDETASKKSKTLNDAKLVEGIEQAIREHTKTVDAIAKAALVSAGLVVGFILGKLFF